MQLYVVPGAGTDWRMYAPQLEQFPNMVVIPWIAPLHRWEGLSSYAKRLAETVDTSSPFILAGASLGGMIVQEMAHYIAPEALIIIASCNSWRAIPWQSGAAVEWERQEELPVRHCHIHGTKDTIIPYTNVQAQLAIKGGHLINVTHPGEVNGLIRSYLCRFESKAA